MTRAETTKAAKQLARLLDLNGSRGESERAESDGEFGELLVLTSALRSVPRVTPRQEFRDGLRARLLAEAATMAAPAAVSVNGTQDHAIRATAYQAEAGTQTATLLRSATEAAGLEAAAVLRAAPVRDPLAEALELTRQVARRGEVASRIQRATPRIRSRFANWKRSTSLALASALGAFSVAGTGMALASSRALPGEAFYGLKQASESVQLRMASDTGESGQLHLQFAERRLEELLDGTESLPPQTLIDVLEIMDQHTVAGTNDLLLAYEVSADQAALNRITDFSGRQQDALRRALPQLPSEVTPFAARSLSIVRQVQAHSVIVPLDCPSCVAPPPLLVPHQAVRTVGGAAPSLPTLGDEVTRILPAVPDITQPLPLDLTTPSVAPGTVTGTITGSTPAPPQSSPAASPTPGPLDVGKTLTDTVGGLLGSTPTPKPSPTTSSIVNLNNPLDTVGNLLGQ